MSNTNIEENLKQVINHFKELSEDEYLSNYLKYPHYMYITNKEKCLYIDDFDMIEKYNRLVQDCWQNLSNKIIDKIYYGIYLSKFNDLILDSYNSKNIKINDIQNIEKYFEKLSLENFTMITKLYGLCLKSNNIKIELGDYIICDYAYFQNNYRHFHNMITNDFFEKPNIMLQNCYLIHKNINAINHQKAEFIFYNKIEKFINLILYCCHNISDENNKISYKDNNINISYIISNNKKNDIKTNFKNDSILNPLYELSQSFFEKKNYERLFKYIDNENLNEIEHKLSIAIDWIGQSMRTNNLQQRFTFLNIALETLLSNKVSGIMDYSVTYRLREYSAFLAADNPEQRSQIFDKLPKLYNKRSQISHQGQSHQLKLKDYYDLIDIVYKVTDRYMKLVTDEEIKTIKDLDNYIKSLKGLI